VTPPRLTLGLALLLALLLPGAAGAQTTSAGLPVAPPPSMTQPPPGFSTSARQAIAVADRTNAVRDARHGHGRLKVNALVWDNERWEISYFAGQQNLVEVDVSADGRVTAVWTGVQAASYFTRDFAGQLGSPWLFGIFAVLFVLPFVDPRRPRRLLHLDLLVLLSFGAPFALLNARHATAATWLLYPPLVYLLVRMLRLGVGRRDRAAGPLVPRMPTAVLAIGLVALVGARVTLNVQSPDVIDIGYASVVGADRAVHGEPLYVDNDAHGDTYGPINYIAYMPFEAAFPWKGAWDDVPAAHAAAIAFDVLSLLALFILGCQWRGGAAGRRLGLALAWAWAAYPLGLYSLVQNANDGLVAMLVLWSLVGLSRPPVRGAMLGLAAGAKFFPAALIGAVWRGRGERDAKAMVLTAVTAAGIFAFSVVAFLPEGGLREFWDCTLGFQLSRPPDFSIWGLYGLKPLQLAVEGAALALAVGVGFLPAGRRTLTQVAALAGAVTLAVQLGGGHWFFFYVVWFVPLVLVALFTAHAPRPPEPVPPGAPSAERRELAPA
jgi:hypothetical protein